MNSKKYTYVDAAHPHSDNTSSVNYLLKLILKTYNIENKYYLELIRNTWEKIAGQDLYNHTTKMKYEKECLFLFIDSPSLKNELQLCRTKLVETFNKEIPNIPIKNVKIL
ncbi:MAG: DUF721 domain-containing protein [Bacteroidales bacterium]|nr:DUF721 domain-containing protein [Bacteroidales bacterium]